MIGRMQSDTVRTLVWAPLGTKPAQHDFRHLGMTVIFASLTARQHHPVLNCALDASSTNLFAALVKLLPVFT
jgi:hypothetical protein